MRGQLVPDACLSLSGQGANSFWLNKTIASGAMHVGNCVWWLRRTHEPIVSSTAFWERRVLGHGIQFPNMGRPWRARPFHRQHEALKDYRMICPRLLELRKWALWAQTPVFSVWHTGPCQPPLKLDLKPILTLVSWAECPAQSSLVKDLISGHTRQPSGC